VLVTTQNGATSEQAVQEREEVSTQEEQESKQTELEPTTPTSKRRLPSFFSTIGKSGKAKEIDVTQARLARATRSKLPAITKTEATEKPATKPAAPPTTNKARTTPQAGGFKTRYLLGIGIYMVAANVLGPLETSFINSIGPDPELVPPFNLFGSVVHIRTSTALFLATLVLILLILARLDLIPRSLTPSTSRNRAGQAAESNAAGRKAVPPPIKQGVQGADDDLYQQYRTGQRRDKKH
jgi:hypothetical protein